MSKKLEIPGMQSIEDVNSLILPDGTELDKIRTNKKATRKEMLKALDFVKDRNKELANQLVHAERAIVMRCRMDGCRYGYKDYHKEIKDVCIWCGTERPDDKGVLLEVEKLRSLNDKESK